MLVIQFYSKRMYPVTHHGSPGWGGGLSIGWLDPFLVTTVSRGRWVIIVISKWEVG